MSFFHLVFSQVLNFQIIISCAFCYSKYLVSLRKLAKTPANYFQNRNFQRDICRQERLVHPQRRPAAAQRPQSGQHRERDHRDVVGHDEPRSIFAEGQFCRRCLKFRGFQRGHVELRDGGDGRHLVGVTDKRHLDLSDDHGRRSNVVR